MRTDLESPPPNQTRMRKRFGSRDLYIEDGMFQPGRTQQPVMQEGMTDPRLNETVTHVSELDMDAVIEAVHGWARSLALGFVISMLMMILLIISTVYDPGFDFLRVHVLLSKENNGVTG